MARADILSPHYDDAVLSCWHRVEQPDSQVITVFGGALNTTETGLWDRLTTQTNADYTHKIRQAENRKALVGTSATTIDLAFLDRQYVPLKKRNVTEIADTIEHEIFSDSQVIAAAGIGTFLRRHPDHVATRKAALELFKRGYDVAFYADIPYMLPIRNFDGWTERISVERLKRKLNIDVTIETHELTPEQQLRKQAAVQAFTSQFPMVKLLALGVLNNPDSYRWEAVIRPV